jgi:hypothetical protein
MLGASGSSPGTASGNLTEPEKIKFSVGVSLFEAGAYAQAYRLFGELSSKPNTSVQFNLALCNMLSGEYQDAMILLEKAMRYIPMSQRDLPTDNVYNKLRPIEKTNESYKYAFDAELPTIRPQYVKECITRCLIDVYSELEMWDKARSTAASLTEKGYKNVDASLSRS